MRSRLDDIVEEETAIVDTGGSMTSDAATILHKAYRDVAKRIAERAFRHCAELAYERDADPFYLELQPAPAEEKCHGCGGAAHQYPPSIDRRQGERRNLDDASRYDARTDHYTTMRPGLGRAVYEWLPNRRSGKERRST
jgi:hypothetical protein